jgi:catechol 2,3-dioxygenase-like lactoylglutathione lyase family enzyme
MAARVHHIGIAVPDMETAVKFFREVFGVGSRAVESEKVKNLYIEFENFTVQVCEDPDRCAGAPFGRLDHIAIEVDDLDETADRLEAHGVDVVWERPAVMRQYRTHFTTEQGGVGVQFQLSDTLAEERGGAEFYPEMMKAVAEKKPAKRKK